MSAVPRKIGRYQIRRELGRGSMGVVYAADDPVLGRLVALKTIHHGLGGEAYQRRFFAEARAAAGLSHPGIVVVYDIGLDAATHQLFMALEYLEGRTLDGIVAADGPMPWRRALEVVRDVARALHHAHARGIIHRDVKPSNVMLLDSGASKIMDFGIAKLPASQLTQAGEVFGSPAYMSPERALEQSVDHRADIFSLGAVLYELLTGQRAFAAPSIPAILRRVAGEDPVPPTRMRSGLPAALDGVVARALAKDPARRHQAGEALAADLEEILERRATAVPGAIPPPAVPLPRAAQGTVVAGTTRPAQGDLRLPAGLRVALVVLSGPAQGATFTLDKPRVVLGRAGAGKADLEIADPEISGAHAAVECYGERVVLRDLASTNGTFVGDERVVDTRELADRGEFRAGRSRFMLTLGGGR